MHSDPKQTRPAACFHLTAFIPLRAPRVLIGFAMVFSVASVSFAQIDRSSLSGTVTDSSGRVLPQTHITAVQNSTQLRRETMSWNNGGYAIPELPVGSTRFHSNMPVSAL